jgi:hypothetical protein
MPANLSSMKRRPLKPVTAGQSPSAKSGQINKPAEAENAPPEVQEPS